MSDLESIEWPFELWLGRGPATVLRVASFRGREAISSVASFTVIAAAPPDLDLGGEALLGARAALIAHETTGPRRLVDGVVAAVEPGAARTHEGRRAVRLRVVSPLWMLKWRVTSRIFQGLTVPRIAEKILSAAGVPHVVKLARSYPARAYCVQYRESDHDFLRRVLAEEGIFHYLERAKEPLDPAGDAPPDTLVLADAEQFHPPVPDPAGTPGAPAILRCRDIDGTALRDDELSRFEVRRAVRPRRLLLRDYDFRAPSLDLSSSADVSGQVSPGAPAAGSDLGPLHVYRHRGEYEEPEISASRAAVDLEQHRRDAEIGRGESACRRLAPGHRFHVDAGSAPDVSGDYVITRVDHEGRAPGFGGAADRTYENRFECAPAGRPFRPRRPKRAPLQVCETATVVGPPSEEIHTDALGRIKVQFHWDLDGKRDDASSAWIRVAQGWAGTGWGLQLIPRVGMEVLVTFVGGDVDCPVVIGCLTNAAQPPVFVLPREKTRSGIRTSTTPGGGGFNELSFDDASGSEVLRIHAQRNWESVVLRDHSRAVGNDERIRVGGHREETVAGDRVEQVGGDVTETAEGDRTAIVGGSGDVTVRGDTDIRCAGDLSTFVGGRERRTITGNSDIVIEGDTTVRALGAAAVVIGDSGAPRSLALHVEGTSRISASRLAEISSEEGISLRCGASTILIGPESISISAPVVSVASERSTMVTSRERVAVRAATEATVQAKSMALKAEGASVTLTRTARVDGEKVKLRSRHEPMEDGREPEPPRPTIVEIVDEEGAAVPGQPFVVVQDDGVEIAGVTDDRGRAEVLVEGGASITLLAAGRFERG